MPLTFDAFRERSVLGLVCLDKWVWFSALHTTMLYRDLHTLTPGPDRLGIRAGLTIGLSALAEVESSLLLLYSYSGYIREQRKASFFLLTPFVLSSESPSSCSTGR